ncbi:MAG: ankyrin repeat domain-containing protein [Alphaproteobacteria bacterium]|nr:ankyrin repeat domain-containing protein [Alphaproteobacteria bacterium]
MGGLIIAGLAALILFLFLKTKVSVSDEEIAELRAAEEAKKPSLEEEQKQANKRTLRTDKTTELLVQVMEDGSVDEIRQAMANGINIQQKLQDGQTLLMIAVKNNPNPEVVHFLLDQGIEVNAVDDNGQTALILATAFNPNPEIITTLLDSGADKTIKDKMNKIAADYISLNSSLSNTDIPALLKVD